MIAIDDPTRRHFDMKRFIQFISEGDAYVYASPETAARLNALLKEHGIDLEVKENEFIEEGQVVAFNMNFIKD